MKTAQKIGVIAISLVLMLLADVPILWVQSVPEAQAILGTRRRTAVVAYTAGRAASQSSASAQQQSTTEQQQAATAQQQSATAQQQSATAQQQAAATATTSGQPLPLGAVVTSLPAGCTAKTVNGVEYYYCGGNCFRTAFQGNSLVYVTVKPE